MLHITTSSIDTAALPTATDDVKSGWEAAWEWFLGAPLQIAIIVVASLVVLGVIRSLIKRVTEAIANGSPEVGKDRRGADSTPRGVLARAVPMANPLAGVRRAQRARTIGSVLRSTANVIVLAIMILLVLDTLGVNIAPFIASAGIVGVALGFGAQSLVQDYLSGIFMLLEDQYGVGDTVDFGEVTGTVEDVQLRVTKVRDLEGTLWFVRNGEILRTGNMSQEWSRTLVEFPVSMTADVPRVREVLEAAAARIAEDEELGAYVLEAPEVTGVESIARGRLLFRIRIKTQPAMQWEVARALRVAVRDDLSGAGIPLSSW
ncbi:mechanosensitive ion channel family protein [Paraoerskovia marina]|uniref:Small conductance mechanosensitive channel n=1 Tax=Paraoerskovia marina TaxID=545619 RepID=A0A1H1U9P6_9CELL|nr:mechanosensitive ion channel family protein [Paraoerskovia marina]SDS69083.1 small conductance mechanosensitive channel [Paraoerskovia marina]